MMALDGIMFERVSVRVRRPIDHNIITTQEDGQLVLFSDHEHQVDKSLITLVKSDKAGLHARDCLS